MHIWGMHNGVGGDQLPLLNQEYGPFPPQAGSTGRTALGWPEMGNMRMYPTYGDYIAKFPIIYPHATSPAACTTAANQLWNFARRVQEGDLVICPCSSQGLLMVGEFIGGYWMDFGTIAGLRPDFVHFRSVRWLQIIPRTDPRFSRLNRIGLLTFSEQRLTEPQLRAILAGAPIAEPAT